MDNIIIPDNVAFIIDRFYEAGYNAYAVGGCVRDSLLGKIPYDWDICTDALPEKTKEIFKDLKVIETGIKHGTVSVIIDKNVYEITTYRIEKGYTDNRHPDGVIFTDRLEEDLKRRDFTVNAIAYNKRRGLVDIFDGIGDIKKGIIRCVGDPNERFSEDALRIMRAVRFSAVLDFSVEKETKVGIFKNKDLLANIATERINTEFSKILLSQKTELIVEFKEVFAVFFEGTKKINERCAKIIKRLEKRKDLRLAALLICIEKYDDVRNILTGLKYDGKTVTGTEKTVACYFDENCKDKSDICFLLSKYGYDTVRDTFMIKKAAFETDGKNDVVKKYDELLYDLEYILKNNVCYKISELKISGKDLKKHGIVDGVLIGKILDELLNDVILGKVENEHEKLIGAALKK